MVASALDPKPAESNFITSGVHALVILPTGTGKVKAYCRGAYTTLTFGYKHAKAPFTFVPFSTLTPVGASATEEVFLEPGPGVQVYVSVVGASGDGAFIALSKGY